MNCAAQALASMLVILGLISSMSLHATGNYCDNSRPRNFISAAVGKFNQARLDNPVPAEVEISTNEVNAVRVLDQQQRHPKSIGFNFRYTIVDLDSVDAMTNGHLHTWDFPFEGRLHNTQSGWLYNVAPVISVSSNGLKNPENIGSDGLQLYAGMAYKKHITSDRTWYLGFKSDHRFGSYKAYPVGGICMQANDWELQLAVPDFRIAKRFNSEFSLKFFIEPVGNQWQVFNEDITRDSNFIYSAIATGLSAKWRLGKSMNVSLDIENQTNRRLEFTLDDNSFVETKVESSQGVTFRGEVLF